MLLSIIIPVFNAEKKIVRCLESLSELKEKSIEFIIVNDGSTDGTKYLCEKYIQRDNRFVLINQKNSGVGKARNMGIVQTKGKYISFIDADDELTTEYNGIIEIIKKIDSDFFAFNHYVKTKEKLEIREREKLLVGENKGDVLVDSFLAGILSCVWNNIYCSNIIKNYNIVFPEDMCMGEDMEFNARYIRHCKNVYYINKIGYKYYFDDSENATNKRKLSYLNDFVKIYDRFVEEKSYYNKLNATFYFPYYIDKVYDILKLHRRNMSSKEKKRFKRSNFYNGLIKYKYRSKWQYIKKWLIRLYII